MKRVFLSVLAITLFFASACNDENDNEDNPNGIVSVTGVTLNLTSLTIEEGQTENLTETIAPQNATDKNITWKSDNEDVAMVTNGVVTAIATGKAVISVTTDDGNKTATCTVTVRPRTSWLKVNTGELNFDKSGYQLSTYIKENSTMHSSMKSKSSVNVTDAVLKTFDMGIEFNGKFYEFTANYSIRTHNSFSYSFDPQQYFTEKSSDEYLDELLKSPFTTRFETSLGDLVSFQYYQDMYIDEENYVILYITGSTQYKPSDVERFNFPSNFEQNSISDYYVANLMFHEMTLHSHSEIPYYGTSDIVTDVSEYKISVSIKSLSAVSNFDWSSYQSNKQMIGGTHMDHFINMTKLTLNENKSYPIVTVLKNGELWFEGVIHGVMEYNLNNLYGGGPANHLAAINFNSEGEIVYLNIFDVINGAPFNLQRFSVKGSPTNFTSYKYTYSDENENAVRGNL